MTTFSVALLASLAAVGVVAHVLVRLGVMDVPNHRSSHRRPVPRGGGAAIVPVMALSLAVRGSWPAPLGWVLGGAALLGIVGLVDDVRDVPATIRLGLQLLVSAGVGAAVLSVGADLPPPALVVVVAAAAVCLTGAVNIVNFMDGANGVAGLHAVLAGGWFAYLGTREDVPALTLGGLALLGAALGFLPWNFPAARVFLGDAGSYSMGVVVGGLCAIALVVTGSPVLALAASTVFVTDTSVTLLRRARAGKPLMTAHREHVYQRLASTPGSPWPAVATAVPALVCVTAAALAPTALCLAAWAVTLAAYTALPHLVRRRSGTAAG